MTKTEYNKVQQKETEYLNDDEQKVEREKLESKVNEPVKKRKAGLIERLTIGMLGPDGIQQIGTQIKQDIVIPAIKNVILDATQGVGNAVVRSIFGDDYGHQPNQNYYGGSYSKYWNSSQRKSGYYNNNPKKTTQTRTYHSEPQQKGIRRGSRVADYVIATRPEAADILVAMREQIQQYGYCSIADYYDLIGEESEYTDNNFGWDDLDTSIIRTAKNGYVIVLPPVDII